MRVAVLCSGGVLQPTLEVLASQGLLVGLGVPVRTPELHAGLEQAARQIGIPFVSVTAPDIEGQLAGWLDAADPDVVCVMGFPHKIPAPLLGRPRLGLFNLHGGALPRYRGPDPVFWQIRNLEPNGAITIHRITEALDAGGIAYAEPVPIGPEDTYGLHMQRLGAVLPRVMIEFVQRLAIQGSELPLAEQAAAEVGYWKRPAEADLTIDWNAPAEEIDALVRACNPRYGGALTALKGIPLRLLQVSDGGARRPPNRGPGTVPGTVVQADPVQGLGVACGDGRTLFLEIVYAEDGFFSGRQLVRLFGVGLGDALGLMHPVSVDTGDVPLSSAG